MKLVLTGGATSQTVNIFVQDSSATTGVGLSGLAFDTASLIAYYVRPKAAAVAITLATLAAVTSVFSSGGFKEIDAVNMKGVYRLDIPNAAIAAGVSSVVIMLSGAANMAPVLLEIQIDAPVQLNLAQAVPTSNTAETMGDCLIAARAQGFGKWAISGNTLSIYANDAVTVLRSFTLDSATSPSSRT